MSLLVRDTTARATAVVTVVDETGDPVVDATVTGDWLLNGTLVQSDQTALTGSDGRVSLIKRFDGIASGDVIEFCVTNITHASLVYDPTSNVETCGQATVGGNQAPTASFTFACTNLSCDFDGTGSSDSDGSISSYDWDFGDGSSGSGAHVTHTYTVADTYTVVLTVTDNAGATGTATAEATVAESALMHVSDVSVSLLVRDTKARATAVVTVVDETGDPVVDATVTGDWLLNGTLVQSDQTALTGSDGRASLIKRFDGIASGDVIEFCVTNITHGSLVYDPSANVETCGQATVP
ncbi:MAG TPA: PKD domain-containing protein [Acidimicrobiia bacterium]|nr:PKD domain-containing protein [Acidimicrobiia bacterium]